MYEVPEGLQEYLRCIRSGDFLPNGFEIPACNEFYVAALKLCGGRLQRKKRIRSAFAALAQCGYIGSYRLTFKLHFKEQAYMTDSGKVCFSTVHVLKTRKGTLAKLLFHEAAHLWLCRQPEYGRLKSLDKAFRARYGSECLALSPIEYYAISLSALMLEKLSTVAEGNATESIEQQIEHEKNKLTNVGILSQ